MNISLEKNQKFNLTKSSDLLKRVRAVLSWTTPTNVFPKYDLDVSAFLLDTSAKLLATEGFIYYNFPAAPDGSVWMGEDEREGGQEELFIDIDKMSDAVAEISVFVTIHKAEERRQNFNKVKDAKIVIFDWDTGETIASFALNEVEENATAVHVGSFYQQNNEFLFQPIEHSYQLRLADIITGYTN